MNRRDFQRKFDPTGQDWNIINHFGWYEDTAKGNAQLKAHVGGTIERIQELRTMCKQFIAGEIELEDSDFYKFAKSFETKEV